MFSPETARTDSFIPFFRKAFASDPLSWKNEYLKWYKFAEEVLSGAIPHLESNEVFKFVSVNDWLILPTGTEKDKSEATTRSDANMYFSLRNVGRIRIGLVCNTLESVRRMRNILHGIHTAEKANFINQLRNLDSSFETVVERKIKEYNPLQKPEYEPAFKFPTNAVDDSLLSEAFERIDRILEEGDELKRIEPKKWRVLAPRLVITQVTIDRDEDKFKEVLRKLKPAYEIALRIKTTNEIDEEIRKRENRITEEKQQKFRDFVENLKNKGVHGEEYREAISRWQKKNS